MYRFSVTMMCVLVGCAGAHQQAVDPYLPPPDPQPVEPQQDAQAVEPDAGQETPQDAAPAPAPGQDAAQVDASTPSPDAGARDAQAPVRDSSSQPVPDSAVADAGQPDAVAPTPDAAAPMQCLDVAPTDPVRELVGGAPFDCAGTAPCDGAVTNAALVRAWCESDTVPIGQGFQARWWGYATLLPDVQVPRSACVRIIAAGHCTLTSSFGVTYTKWARAPQLNVQGWVEVDSSMPGALACDLSCGGMSP